MPIAFIGVVVLARARGISGCIGPRAGLSMRAVGLDETSARRLGSKHGPCDLPGLRGLLGHGLHRRILFSPPRSQIGSPIVSPVIAVASIAAAVLGGASLAGGRGSFVGAVLAALFFSLIGNVLPLFQQPTEYARYCDRRLDPGRARPLPGTGAVESTSHCLQRPSPRADTALAV